jgi:bacillithiol biosynthesis cysteine-adding enzyme BshC
MKVDKPLLKLIDQFSGQLTTHAFGTVIIELLKSCYKEYDTIERSTFKLINELFKAYGLIVLLPDNSALKKLLTPVASKELIENFSHKAVDATVKNFPPEYKVQAAGRDINLFYLKDNSRERITLDKSLYKVQNTNLSFTEKELLADLENNPERFSPNVILRPVFQEMILPNVAFIGGGGELAYWLELIKVFEESNVPLPVMVLRNSFLVIDKAAQELMQKLKLTVNDVFENETALINSIVKRQTDKQLSLDKEKESLAAVYKQIEEASGKIDATLIAHTQNLYTKALKKIEALEKKMLKAEKKKFDAQQRQVSKLKSMLFPNGHLQEREENLLPWYAKHGKAFIQTIYENSLRLEQEFAVVLL